MSEQFITHKEHKLFIDDFLKTYAKSKELDLQKGIPLKSKKNIESPFVYTLKYAMPEDAVDITNIIKSVYRGTYPYKELEDPEEIKRKIKDPDFNWVVFQKDSGENIACGAYEVNLETKSGTFHAVALKRKYHGKVRAEKAGLMFLSAVFSQYLGKVLRWSCEVVSHHYKSQVILKHLGMIPIAFLPKKDIFYEREVSEFIYIIYDKEMFSKYRLSETPNLINRALFSYFYSQQKFNLELPKVHGLITHNLHLDKAKIKALEKNLITRIEKDNFGKELVSFQIKNSESYFKFLHRANLHNVETLDYHIAELEELHLFTREIKQFIKNKKINYFELFVSAYEPCHQKLFYNAGFKPTGYIPSWKFDPDKNGFVDQLLFVYYKGKSFNNIKLIPDTVEFLKTIKFYNKIELAGLKPF
ncbi:MAG: hypothetical protein EU548_07730 [Promethearchaeota archaeon]|nr:MAG: hypothetical protein EU548_07730 [Candidatus Lokiarchaeota archaeon]